MRIFNRLGSVSKLALISIVAITLIAAVGLTKKPNTQNASETNVNNVFAKEIFWHVKAIHPDGDFLDVKAIGKDGKIYDIKWNI